MESGTAGPSLRTVRVGPSPFLAVDVAGRGPAVVLLHGVGGNRGNWRDQVAALAPGFRALAPDARGYGDSDDAPGPTTVADMAGDVRRVLDHFGVARAHLVGLSMGGLVALAFHGLWPGRVATLALCDTGPGFRADARDKAEAFLRQRRQPLLDGRTPAEIAPAAAAALVGPDAAPAAVARVVESLSALRAGPYLKALEAVTRHDARDRLGAIGVPTLVMVGAHDRVTPPRVAEAMAAAIPGAELVVLADAGHLGNLERPDAFNAALLGFLRRHPG